MDNKINEFIESLLPVDINHTKKENLKYELESHILDAIDFMKKMVFLMKKVLRKH